MSDLISRKWLMECVTEGWIKFDTEKDENRFIHLVRDIAPSAQPDTEKICARIKAEALKCNVEYMKHGDRYMLGFVDGMRLARRIVDGTVDDPVYFTTSGGIERWMI